MFEVIGSRKGIFRMRQMIGVDPVKKALRIDPRAVECIADAHDVGVVLFGERMNLGIKEAVRIDKRLDRGLKF